jgi:hypothetical protein
MFLWGIERQGLLQLEMLTCSMITLEASTTTAELC